MQDFVAGVLDIVLDVHDVEVLRLGGDVTVGAVVDVTGAGVVLVANGVVLSPSTQRHQSVALGPSGV